MEYHIHMEPPFSMLAKKSNQILTFEKELKLIELLEYFQEKYGEEFKQLVWDKKSKEELHKMLSIIINGQSYRHDEFLNTLLKDGDDISFIYIFFGG